MHGERPHIRGILDGLVGGLASAVAGAGVNAQQMRAGPKRETLPVVSGLTTDDIGLQFKLGCCDRIQHLVTQRL
jgi:hypothetical protein